MVKKAELYVPLAVSMVTQNPARINRLSGKGTLEPGKDADLVLFDDDIQIRDVYVKGRKIVL
jgi:N-acetylglucosamine-6-phosphate deacetylase